MIYVSTYEKYNSGSLSGGWLDPSDYANRQEFLVACYLLHKDEEDPELMFQYDGIPEDMDENHIDDDLWDSDTLFPQGGL